MNTEKRQSPRVEIFGELQGHAILLDEPVTIKQMSRGGLTLATRFPFRIGSLHEFQVTLGSKSVVVKGRVLHQRMVMEQDESWHVAGIQLMNVSEELATTLEKFLEAFQVADA